MRRVLLSLDLSPSHIELLDTEQEVANIKMTISPPSYFHWVLGDKKYTQGAYEHDGMCSVIMRAVHIALGVDNISSVPSR